MVRLFHSNWEWVSVFNFFLLKRLCVSWAIWMMAYHIFHASIEIFMNHTPFYKSTKYTLIFLYIYRLRLWTAMFHLQNNFSLVINCASMWPNLGYFVLKLQQPQPFLKCNIRFECESDEKQETFSSINL